MADRVGDWVGLVDALYPQGDAESWDATGLQVGDPGDDVNGVLVALDVTEATIDEAVEAGANLLLVHHPLLFRPLPRLTPHTAPGRLALRAARAGVSVLAAHTNFDAALDGTTDPVVRFLGLLDVRPLQPTPPRGEHLKLVTYVPAADTEAVLAALSRAGAGAIGEYDECSFRVRGTGTFRPSAAANPAVGDRGVRNEVAEDRLEMILPAHRLGAVVDALLAAHPYEEVAYDVFALQPAPTGKGIGRVGRLPAPMALSEVADVLADGLPSPHLRVAGDLDRVVEVVAACGGAGDSLIGAALSAGAHVYVTGDLRHHVTLDAMTMGMAAIDAGHYATEAPALATLVVALRGAAARRGLEARLLPSQIRTEPWAAWWPQNRGQA